MPDAAASKNLAALARDSGVPSGEFRIGSGCAGRRIILAQRSLERPIILAGGPLQRGECRARARRGAVALLNGRQRLPPNRLDRRREGSRRTVCRPAMPARKTARAVGAGIFAKAKVMSLEILRDVKFEEFRDEDAHPSTIRRRNGRLADAETRISEERTNRSEGRPPPDGGEGAAGGRADFGVRVSATLRGDGRGAGGFRGAEGFEGSGERARETGGIGESDERRARCGVGDLASERASGRQRRGIFGGASRMVATGGPTDRPLILPASGGSISAARPRSRG